MRNTYRTHHRPPVGHQRERGVVAMLFALSIVVLFGFTALVIDLGNARQTARGVQSASDAAVLAGAQDLPIAGVDPSKSSDARGIAASYAAASLSGTLTTTGCSGGTADTDCFSIGVRSMEVTSPYEGDPQQIFTRICEPTETFFAGAIGQSSPTVCRSAVAEVSSSAGGSPAILALHPSACGAINTHGNGDILAVGLIQVNSSCPSAALTQEGSNSQILSDSCVCVVGGFDMQFPGNAIPAAASGAPLVADPYASVPDISQPGTNGQQSGTTFTPGYYAAKIKIDSPGIYTFLPGIYYLDAGLRFEGSATIVADNVLFYVAGGMLDMGSGPTDLRMSGLSAAQDPDNVFLGLAVFQARSNTKAFLFGDNVHAGVRSADVCTVTPSSGIAGGIYLPSAPLNVRGNGSTLCTTLPIVANTIKVEETSTLSGTAFVGGGTPTIVIALID